MSGRSREASQSDRLSCRPAQKLSGLLRTPIINTSHKWALGKGRRKGKESAPSDREDPTKGGKLCVRVLLRAAPARGAVGRARHCCRVSALLPHLPAFPARYLSERYGGHRSTVVAAGAGTHATHGAPADTSAVLSISRIHLRALTRGRTHAGAMAPGVRRASPVCYRWVDGRLPVRGSAGVRR